MLEKVKLLNSNFPQQDPGGESQTFQLHNNMACPMGVAGADRPCVAPQRPCAPQKQCYVKTNFVWGYNIEFVEFVSP